MTISTKTKIQSVSYFCFAYAFLQLVGVVFILLNEGFNLQFAQSAVDVGICLFIGYVLQKQIGGPGAHRLALLFLALLLIRPVIAVPLLGSTIVLSTFLNLPLISLILMIIVWIGALVSLVILLQKDVKSLFPKKNS